MSWFTSSALWDTGIKPRPNVSTGREHQYLLSRLTGPLVHLDTCILMTSHHSTQARSPQPSLSSQGHCSSSLCWLSFMPSLLVRLTWKEILQFTCLGPRK